MNARNHKHRIPEMIKLPLETVCLDIYVDLELKERSVCVTFVEMTKLPLKTHYKYGVAGCQVILIFIVYIWFK